MSSSYNNDSAINTSHFSDMSSTGEVKTLTLFTMVAIDLMAFCANLLNIIAISYATHLRNNLANLFVLNLSVIDVVASLILLPAAIISFFYDSWMMGTFMCTFVGFLGSLLTIASIATICGISIERFYSIKYPMHHAAHMTITKTLVVISLIWGISVLVSVMPLIGINSYTYQLYKKQCSFSTEFEILDRIYVIGLSVLAFYLPGCVLLVMYWSVFIVARHAVIKVRPETSAAQAGPSMSLECTLPNSRASASHRTRSTRGHLKAAQTLTIILLAYTGLWGPYFIYHTNAAVQSSRPDRKSVVEILVLWFGYTTFAINPILYGCMNRSIRMELVNICKIIFCCRTCAKVDAEDEGDAEDFFQFLEGTSTKLAVISHNGHSGITQKTPSSESGIGIETFHGNVRFKNAFDINC